MVRELLNFDGRTAVVTGAASGIGESTAQLLANAGAKVIGLDRSWPRRARRSFLEQVLVVDVTDPGTVSSTIRDVVRRYGAPAVLVNAAGVPQRSSTLRTDVSEWDRAIDINLRGTFLVCRETARAMVKRRRGSIVNVASQLAFAPPGGRPAYIASKLGVVGLTRTLAAEWASAGVRVNAVAPGVTKTAMIRNVTRTRAQRRRLEQKIPLGRMADPGEVAAAIAFLASDAASYITGTVLMVDGGYTIS